MLSSDSFAMMKLTASAIFFVASVMLAAASALSLFAAVKEH
jgi:hypothetical protein